MTSAKQIELTLRIAKLVRDASQGIGEKSVPVARLIITNVEHGCREIREFLNTAEKEDK